jgi:ribosomal protein S6--L-glutamate ligase
MNIVILSRNPALYSTQSLVNAARKRNHYVRVFDHMQCDIVIEENRPAIYYHGQEIKNIQAVIPRIGSSATSYGASVIRQFELMKVFTTLTADPLIKARDKITCMQILASNGISVPKSTIFNNLESIDQMIDEVGPMPFVIKLVNGTHGLGVMLAEQKKIGESIIEAFYKAKQKVFLQKFIHEAKGADVRVFIVNNEVVGVMKRQAKEGEFRSNLHRGATSEVIKLTDEEMHLARKAARVMGLKVAGVDMLQTSKGPMVLEVNASPGLEGIETTTGNDIASKIIKYIEKNYNYR